SIEAAPFASTTICKEKAKEQHLHPSITTLMKDPNKNDPINYKSKVLAATLSRL
ncbi:MAG: hypothetical protein RLZZ379_255, partial [Pseudomonadota bacterium]